VRRVQITNDFGSVITAHFQEVDTDIVTERTNYNYYANAHDFMALATHTYDWIIRGVLP
jgi:hypothetical protein